ncbi:sodium-coupled monocarboxylate transporter 1-like isoform X1 [Ischnura elegans]|uniref:sodium-coupled monocarboxylate transporter 1-like isoform X1 n=1 Tax=Ischnura elegans TaxID=197161 RepID=UPI001ED8B149|nr:sodium-coupled monocarboxylate transporter 1-like isoform X1 [Ischnura elegans]
MGDAAEEDVWLAEEGGASSPEATTTFTSEVFDRMAKSTTVGSRFSPVDYAVFCTMLAMSAAIGMYFAFCAKQKQNTTSEYLMGGKKMGIIPVSLSLIASLVSGVTLLGFPAEMYLYGTQFVMFHAGIILAAIPVSLIFVPVYYKLQLTSCYEYLELRFDRKVRLLGSTLYCIFCLLNIPIIIYLPALAFSQVSGFNIHVITPVVCLVCIFYTSLGGMKAVVWTDSLQVIMIFGAMISVICIGTQKVGGVDTVFQRSNDSGRIDFFNMSFDPTIRHTFWNTMFGFVFSWSNNCSTNQGIVQRFLAMPTMRRAQIIVYIYTFGTAAITLISCYAGLLVYASYYDCDPLTTKAVRAPDQLLPYFVMDLAEYFPGLPGLFIAGVFSAALSTMSTSLNAMSGVIYQSYIKPRFQTPPSEARASCTMKVLCAAIGIFCVLMVFIVEHLGTVAQLSISFGGVTSGPSLSMFVLGMFFPWANAKGAFAGGLTGLLVMGTISFGTQYANARGQIKHPRKPLSTAGCFVDPTEGPVSTLASLVLDSTISLNSTMESPTMGPATVDPPWPIFRISYTLYCMLGMAISLTVGLIVSLLTKPTRPEDLHIDLLSPVIRPYFSQRCRKGPEDERETTSWENGERKGEEFGMDTREVFLKNKDTTDMTKEERKLLKGSR